MKRSFNTVKKFLPIIGIAILIYLIYDLGIGEIKQAFFTINPIYIVLASLLTVPRVLIRNSAWMLIHKEQKIKISYFESLKIFLIGFFYGSVSPGYFGQLMRVPYLKEKTGEPYGKLFVNSIIETNVHTFSLYIMMIVGAMLIISDHPTLFYLVCIWFVSVIVVLFYFVKKDRGEKVFFNLIKYLVPKRFRGRSNRFVKTFYYDFPKIRNLIPPLLVGSITWFIIFSQEYIVVLSMGLDISFLYFLFLFPIANVAGFIPISFAGLGPREFTSVYLFSIILGIPKAEVFVFTIIGFLITDILTGFIGFLVSLYESRHKNVLLHVPEGLE